MLIFSANYNKHFIGSAYKISPYLLGVRVYENCKVTKIINQENRVQAVETTHGTIKCEHFVNCAGFWARNVGKLSEPYVKVVLPGFYLYYN